MSIDANGAGAWPSGWQEVGAVPYQLIITMPEYTWIALAQLVGFFLAWTALVVFVTRKKIGFGWGSAVGVVVAFVACIPMFMSIDFGPQRFETQSSERVAPLELLPLLNANEVEHFKSTVCKNDQKYIPRDMLEMCAKRNQSKAPTPSASN